MVKNKGITTKSQIDPAKMEAAVAEFGQERVDATIKNRGITSPGNDLGTGDSPAPINKEDITPSGTDVADVTEKTDATNVVVGPDAPGTRTVDEDGVEDTDLIKKEKAALKATEEAAAGLKAEADAKIAEDLRIKNEREAEAKKFADEQAKIIKDKEDELKKVQDEIAATAEQAKQDELNILKQEQVDAASLAKAELALQKQKDEEAIRDAEIQIDIDKERSAIAFNKLGLSFSSGIILQSQKITDNALRDIATLRVQANFNQTKAAVDLNAINLQYSRDVNDTIDKYTTIQLNNKKDIANRINDTKNNLLLSNKAKQDAINTLEDDYRKEKKETEDKLRTEQERLADKTIKQTKDIEASYKQIQTEGKADAELRVNNGEISRMTQGEITALEASLGLPVGTLKTQQVSKLNTSFRAMYDNLIGKDYNIGNINALMVDAETAMRSGKSMTEAITFAINNDLKTNKEYERKQTIKKATENAKLAAAQKAAGGGAAGAAITPADRDAFLKAGGRTSDLKNLEKTGGIKAATEALKRGAEGVDDFANKTLKDLSGQLGVFEGNVEAQAKIETTVNDLFSVGFTEDEIVTRLKDVDDLVYETKDGITKFYNNSIGTDNLILTVK